MMQRNPRRDSGRLFAEHQAARQRIV